MAGTWIFLPLSGGGGGSTFYGDPVADQSLLPAVGLLGEIRFAILENQFFSWDGLAWVRAPDDVINARAVNTTGPLSGGGALSSDITLSIMQAGTAQDGYLSSADWTTFNSKQGDIAAGTTSQYFRGDKTFVDLTTDALLTSDGSTAPASTKLGESIASDEPTTLVNTGVGATGAWGDAASVVVPAGRWALGGTVYLRQGTANLTNIVKGGIGTVSAPASLARSATASLSHLITGDYEFSLSLAPRPFTFAAPTTVYLHSNFTYTSGAPLHAGAIVGWRIS
jgi:hypothetical protein